jgi:hypothetical protein
VSKRLGSLYISGRTRHWLKFKSPAAPAVKREQKRDWGTEKVALAREALSNLRGALFIFVVCTSYGVLSVHLSRRLCT